MKLFGMQSILFILSVLVVDHVYANLGICLRNIRSSQTNYSPEVSPGVQPGRTIEEKIDPFSHAQVMPRLRRDVFENLYAQEVQRLKDLSASWQEALIATLKEINTNFVIKPENLATFVDRLQNMTPKNQADLVRIMDEIENVGILRDIIARADVDLFQDVRRVFYQESFNAELLQNFTRFQQNEIFNNLDQLNYQELENVFTSFNRSSIETAANGQSQLFNDINRSALLQKAFRGLFETERATADQFNDLIRFARSNPSQNYLTPRSQVYIKPENGTNFEEAVYLRTELNQAIVLTVSGEKRIPVQKLITPTNMIRPNEFITPGSPILMTLKGKPTEVVFDRVVNGNKLGVINQETGKYYELPRERLLSLSTDISLRNNARIVANIDGTLLQGRIREIGKAGATIRFEDGVLRTLPFEHIRSNQNIPREQLMRYTPVGSRAERQRLSLKLDEMIRKLYDLRNTNLRNVTDPEVIAEHNLLMRDYAAQLQLNGIQVKEFPSKINERFLNLKIVGVTADAPSAAKAYFKALERFRGHQLTFSLVDNVDSKSAGFFQPNTFRVELGYDAMRDLLEGRRTHTALHELRHLMKQRKLEMEDFDLFHASFHQNNNGLDIFDKISGENEGLGIEVYRSYMSLDELYTHGSDIRVMAGANISETRQNLFRLRDKVNGLSDLTYHAYNRLKGFVDSYNNRGMVSLEEDHITLTDEAGRTMILPISREQNTQITQRAQSIWEQQINQNILENFTSREDYLRRSARREELNSIPFNQRTIAQQEELEGWNQQLELARPNYEDVYAKAIRETLGSSVNQRLEEMINFAAYQNEHTRELYDAIESLKTNATDEQIERIREISVRLGRETRDLYRKPAN